MILVVKAAHNKQKSDRDTTPDESRPVNQMSQNSLTSSESSMKIEPFLQAACEPFLRCCVFRKER